MKLRNNLSFESVLESYQSLYKCKYNDFQKKQIEFGYEDGLDINKYASPEFNYSQMHALRDGLILGFDMKPYAKATLDVLSIREEIECLMHESNFDLVRRQKYHRYVSNIYLPLKAKLDLQF